MTFGFKSLWRQDRIRHYLLALGIALLLGVTGLLRPLDWLIWSAHTFSATRSASGEVVFIGATEDLSSSTASQGRRELAKLIEGLDDAGAKETVIDVIIQRPSQPTADRMLAQAIRDANDVHLVRRYATLAAGPRTIATDERIAGSTPQVTAREWVDVLGFTRSANFGWKTDAGFEKSLPALLAGSHSRQESGFRIDYSIDYETIPSYTISEALAALRDGRGVALFGDKVAVVGNGGEANAYASIPGHTKVPASMVAILAAETIRAGVPPDIGWFATFAIFALLFGCVAFLNRQPHVRHLGYLLVCTNLPIWFLISAHLRMTAHLAVPIAFLAVYVSLRLWDARRVRASLVDELSGLPTFRALERDLLRLQSIAHLSVVVAKVHRFDEVLSILPSASHGEYVRLIASRFRITEDKLAVYSNGGRYLAWVQEAEDEPHLEAHLKGLRAVFAYPLELDGVAVDVGITFGADATRETSPARKIASATSAVDKTTEAHNPVVLADAASQTDRMWNVSLQAKIDAALKSGQIYVVYQPQFHLPTNQLLGFEALVRWNDPERGAISPSYFIEQCEHAGRMEALTEKVFHDTVHGIANSAFANGPYRFSVNVSATLLGDDRVVEMLKDALAQSSVARSRITLEITETARIADYEAARSALRKLQALGVRTSIDDFGVGAASLETLLRLPFDELKIDRMFVARIKDDVKAKRIVEALVHLSNGLNLDVIAEGVEDHKTLDILRSLGCEGVQGYALGHPVSLAELEHLATDKLPPKITLAAG